MKFGGCRKIVAGPITCSSSPRRSSSGLGGSGLPLNISSIRSVTRKPPTTLIVPNATAITSSSCSSDAGRRGHQQQPAEHHDPVDRVGARHQRRVQRVRHLRDHREADEAGQHEDRELDDEWASWLSPPQPAPAAAALGALVDDLAVPRDARVRRSPHPRSRASARRRRRSSARAAPRCCARTAARRARPSCSGRLSGARILTSCRTTISPGSDSSQLPPVSPARSTITEPGLHQLDGLLGDQDRRRGGPGRARS